MGTDPNTNTLLAIVSITLVALGMLNQSIDGQLLALAIIAIAGLGGYEVYKKVTKENGGAD